MKRSIWTVLLVALGGLALGTGAEARDKITTIHYDVGIPIGNTKDYIDNESWRGFGLDFRTFRDRDKNITLGFTFAWQVFSQRTEDTIVLENGAVTGTQRRYVNALPFLLTAHYYTSQQSNHTRFFVGAGAGVYYIVQRFDIGVSSREEDNWHFGLMPEVGVQTPMGSDVELFFAARYHYAFAAGRSLTGDGQAWDYFTASVGVAWSRW